MEDILRNTTHELEQTKKKLANCEFELREAKYDTNQHIHKYQKIEEEKKHAEVVFQSKLTEMQLKQDMMIRIHEERYHTIALECDKVCTLLEGFVHTAEECKRRENVSKTMRHILGKTISCLERVKIIATHPHLPLSEIKTKPHPSVKDVLNVDATVDAAMLEMCKSLEEENNILAETVQSLKAELNETKREAAASQLIPHYRLAILRSRTYATNLMEQVQREQATSQALREQLDETYQDLKKVVEDKRKLYKKLSKSTLISEEQEYMKHFTEKQQQHSRHDQQQHTEDKTHHHHVVSSSSSGGHNREQHGTSHVMRALSSTVQDVDMHLQQAELEEGLKMELKVLDDQIGKSPSIRILMFLL